MFFSNFFSNRDQHGVHTCTRTAGPGPGETVKGRLGRPLRLEPSRIDLAGRGGRHENSHVRCWNKAA